MDAQPLSPSSSRTVGPESHADGLDSFSNIPRSLTSDQEGLSRIAHGELLELVDVVS